MYESESSFGVPVEHVVALAIRCDDALHFLDNL